jgi:hypothetical protein
MRVNSGFRNCRLCTVVLKMQNKDPMIICRDIYWSARCWSNALPIVQINADHSLALLHLCVQTRSPAKLVPVSRMHKRPRGCSQAKLYQEKRKVISETTDPTLSQLAQKLVCACDEAKATPYPRTESHFNPNYRYIVILNIWRTYKTSPHKTSPWQNVSIQNVSVTERLL